MIIDSHVHIGKMLNFNMSEEQVLYSMETYEIDYCLVSNIECSENDHQMKPLPLELQKPQNLVLENTLQFAREHADRIGVLAWLKIRTERPDARHKELFWLIFYIYSLFIIRRPKLGFRPRFNGLMRSAQDRPLSC